MTITRTAASVGWSRLQPLGTLLLVVASAWPAPIVTLAALTLTGDRLLGLLAVPLFAFLALRNRVHWTGVHTALAVFVAAQILTSALNAHVWPQGLKFVTVYVLAFACFALTAELTRDLAGRRRMVVALLVVATAVSIAGMVTAHLSNIYQKQWGTGVVQILFRGTAHERALFAPKVTFGEWNLYSSFLLIPFAVGLWIWRRDGGGQKNLVAAVGTILFGLVAGVTRATLVAMLGIIVAWCALARPRARQIAAVSALLAAALLLQTLTSGLSPLRLRISQRSTLVTRAGLNWATVESWLKRPLVGHGAGSTNGLVLPSPLREWIAGKTWSGNLVLFLLHDSGLLGFATLLGVAVVVARRAWPTLGRAAPGEEPSLATPLLVGGAAVGFAYQFTHGLWIMYPYVCLGFLTAVTGTDARDR